MDVASHARAELDHARAALGAMESSHDLDAFERSWKEFLHRIERVWNKSEAHFKRSPKWNGWKGTHETLRRTDSLLSYLVNARGAEEHTVEPITERTGSQLSFQAGPTGSALIRRIAITKEGQLLVDGEGSLEVSFSPERIRLLPILNRGRSYAVPSQHLGKGISPETSLRSRGPASHSMKTSWTKPMLFLLRRKSNYVFQRTPAVAGSLADARRR